MLIAAFMISAFAAALNQVRFLSFAYLGIKTRNEIQKVE
ncbi:MAG: hypothetical protein ACI9J0_004086 [Cryomorphaceae bacterium]|jgi:hypothetical protein